MKMFWRLLSVAFIVLGLGTVDADAAKKKYIKVTAPVVTTVAKVAKKKPAVVAKSAPAKAAKALAKKKAAKKKAKPKPLSAEVCLARFILGEAGLEPTEGRKAVAYVAMNYAKKITRRSICKEVYSDRYSWHLIKRNRDTVRRTVGEDWVGAKKVAVAMLRNPVPPRPILKNATTYFVPSDSSEDGKSWIWENTYPLGSCEVAIDYQIGNHVFREERVHANRRGMICPRQKPEELTRVALIPIPRMKPAVKRIALK